MKNAFICILKIANEHNIELMEFSFFFFFSFSCQVSILYLMKQHRPAQHRNMPTIAPIIPPISSYMVPCESPSKKQQSINDFFNGPFQAIWGLFQALMAYSNRSSLITATLFLELVRLISEMRDITKHFLLYNSYELHQTASK